MIKTILVAEDERSNAVLLSKRLEKDGYNVLLASNGLQALEILRSRPVDLLITDVVMPEMDGVDLYMALKDDLVFTNLPVLIMTDKEVFRESFTALGVDIYCPKPFNYADLLEKVKKIERQGLVGQRYQKVLVVGPQPEVVDQMRCDLLSRNCIVGTVDNVIEIGLRCFTLNPGIIILDLHAREYATTKEIIRSLRAYKYFANTIIAIYSHVGTNDVSEMGGVDNIELEIKMCLEAGANKYIGRFNKATFLDQLKEFNI